MNNQTSSPPPAISGAPAPRPNPAPAQFNDYELAAIKQALDNLNNQTSSPPPTTSGAPAPRPNPAPRPSNPAATQFNAYELAAIKQALDNLNNQTSSPPPTTSGEPAPAVAPRPIPAVAPRPAVAQGIQFNNYELAAIKQALDNLHSTSYVPPASAPNPYPKPAPAPVTRGMTTPAAAPSGSITSTGVELEILTGGGAYKGGGESEINLSGNVPIYYDTSTLDYFVIDDNYIRLNILIDITSYNVTIPGTQYTGQIIDPANGNPIPVPSTPQPLNIGTETSSATYYSLLLVNPLPSPNPSPSPSPSPNPSVSLFNAYETAAIKQALNNLHQGGNNSDEIVGMKQKGGQTTINTAPFGTGRTQRFTDADIDEIVKIAGTGGWDTSSSSRSDKGISTWARPGTDSQDRLQQLRNTIGPMLKQKLVDLNKDPSVLWQPSGRTRRNPSTGAVIGTAVPVTGAPPFPGPCMRDLGTPENPNPTFLPSTDSRCQSDIVISGGKMRSSRRSSKKNSSPSRMSRRSTRRRSTRKGSRKSRRSTRRSRK